MHDNVSKYFYENLKVLINREKTKSVLLDFFHNDLIKVKLLMKGYDNGIVNDIISIRTVDTKTLVDKLVKKEFLDYDVAQNIVFEWKQILSDYLQEIISKQINEDKEKHKCLEENVNVDVENNLSYAMSELMHNRARTILTNAEVIVK